MSVIQYFCFDDDNRKNQNCCNAFLRYNTLMIYNNYIGFIGFISNSMNIMVKISIIFTLNLFTLLLMQF